MSKTIHLVAAALSLALVSAAPAARADDHPCKDDVKKFCKGDKPGKGRFMECLKEHEADLTPACREHLAAMKEKIHGVLEACRADAAKLCKDEKPGEGRIAICLKAHEKELSDPCKAAIANAKAK